jgi:hypothetical protein
MDVSQMGISKQWDASQARGCLSPVSCPLQWMLCVASEDKHQVKLDGDCHQKTEDHQSPDRLASAPSALAQSSSAGAHVSLQQRRQMATPFNSNSNSNSMVFVLNPPATAAAATATRRQPVAGHSRERLRTLLDPRLALLRIKKPSTNARRTTRASHST